MAGSSCEDYGAAVGLSSLQHCRSVDSLAEWRSREQVENGTPSTSPPYWDTDDDDDSGVKPSELYGKFTWKIENYLQISKRELRSNAFEVGGYKWYILIYPQGCDVPNHLSLFLCVANHDKLLPGWSHFAQFTIALVNKDPKKSKYSDTLHRFWKKEHDWGWKKFMELTKLSDGFIVDDTLVIKAQVQVIREKAHRPFRCLDYQYRRELVRVSLSNVEQIFRRFVEERRGKLSKLIEDKVKWSSFRAFWLGVDQNSRRRMSRDKTDAILKVVVKHFFIEKEYTSTLVMDSLYSGLKALECQSKNKKGRTKLLEMEESLPPMVCVEKDMFVLAEDVLLLLERASMESLPHQPLPLKDDKGSQNRKDVSSGDEFNKDSIERDERRLTELGRRTVEIFVLAHIFCSRIEVAYQEAVALKRQEELIREEEAAQSELKTKRGASEKEKRTKKKQTKQRRSSRKGKDRGRDEKLGAMMQEKHHADSSLSNERILGDLSLKQAQPVLGKIETVEDVSDVSDNGNDDDDGALQPDLEDRDTSLINSDTDMSEIHPVNETNGSEIQNGQMEKKSPFLMDDSSSTCSTDSVPSVVLNGPYKANTSPSNKSQASPNRGKHQRKKDIHGRTHGGNKPLSDATADAGQLRDVTGRCRATVPESEAIVLSFKDRIQWLEKEEEVVSLQKSSVKDEIHVDRPSKSSTEQFSSSTSPVKESSVLHQRKQSSENTTTRTAEPVSTREINPTQSEKSVPLVASSPQTPSTIKSEALRHTAQVKSVMAHQLFATLMPLSTPLIPELRPAAPVASTVQTMPLLSRSVSAVGRLSTDPSSSAQSYIPQSYRNAIMGRATMDASLTGFTQPSLSSSSQAAAYSQFPSAFTSSSVHLPQTTLRKDQSSFKRGFSFGSVAPDALHSLRQWSDDWPHQEVSGNGLYSVHRVNGAMRLDNHGGLRSNFQSGEVSLGDCSPQAQEVMLDEFPHLDIINDLLDEELSFGKTHSLSRQYTFPGDVATADIGPSSGSCWFNQPEQFFDGAFQRVYGSSSMAFNGLTDMHPLQVDFSSYANGQIDGVIQHQWPLGGPDFSMLSLGSADASEYSYQIPDYSNFGCSLSGFDMYQPANGS